MDLFNEESDTANKKGKGLTNPHSPLATRMRPRSLDEFVGQDHIVGEGKMLRRMIESGVIGSLVFYGPPGSGKTTLAHVISREINAEFEILNAVLDGIKDLRKVVERAEKIQQMNGRKTILFVDEIHRWNKAQQDALLPHLESGVITLIGATTENPFYSLVSPLLSRCQLFELYDLQVEHVLTMIDRSLQDEERGLGDKDIEVTAEARQHLAEYAGGDIRNAINALEIGVLSSEKDDDGVIHIDLDIAKECIQKRSVRYDSTGERTLSLCLGFYQVYAGF
ncbi:MAG: AAA family ATPase [Balneolaceae bacterium]|nr:AAA family ATPase [Balneolaceae bacterium]